MPDKPNSAPPGKALGEVKGPAKQGAPGAGMAIGGPHADTPAEVGPKVFKDNRDLTPDKDDKPPATPKTH